MMKFLFVFDKTCNQQKEDVGKSKQCEDVIKALVDTLSKTVSVQFLKQLTEEEVKVVFYAVWNIAFEAKDRSLF